MKMRLGIYGAGATAQELFEMVKTMNNPWDDIRFIDDTLPCGLLLDCKRTPYDVFAQECAWSNTEVAIAVGDPQLRNKLVQKVRDTGFNLAKIVHPTAQIASTAQIMGGCVIRQNAVISVNTVLDENVWVQRDVIMGHDIQIGQNSFIAAGCFIAGHTVVGNNCFLGPHSCVKDSLRIGNNAVVVMGAVVLKDIADDMIVIGNPARVTKAVEGKSLFGRQS